MEAMPGTIPLTLRPEARNLLQGAGYRNNNYVDV